MKRLKINFVCSSKNLRGLILSAFCTILIVGLILRCSKDSNKLVAKKETTMLLPEANKQSGELLSEVMHGTAISLKNQDIVFSDTHKVKDILQKVAEDIYKERGLDSSNEDALIPKLRTLEDVLSDKTVSDIQKTYLKKIEAARINSQTYAAFSQALVEINNEIVSQLPNDSSDRAALLNVTATLHYGLKTVNDLVNEGFFKGSSRESYPYSVRVSVIEAGFFPNLFISPSESSGCKGWWRCWGKCATSIAVGTAAGVGTVILSGGVSIIGAILVTGGTAGMGALSGC